MLTINFFADGRADPESSLNLVDLRITGGAIWNAAHQGLIASYAGGRWKHRGRRFLTLTITGGGCLLFGIAREPTLVSESVDRLYLIGPTLCANGIAIAKFIEQQDTWHGLVRPLWWTSMRIVSRDGISALIEGSEAILLNPWEHVPLEQGSSRSVSQRESRRKGYDEPPRHIVKH